MENFILKKDKFLQGEFNTLTSIRLDKTYIDMVDDLKAGLLLSQIVYWHLPSQETGEIRLKVEFPKGSGDLWLVKRRKDWYDEIRLSPKEYDKAKSKLIEKKIIKVELHQFKLEENNYKEAPMDFIQIDWNVFLELRDKVIQNQIETKKEKVKEKKQRELIRLSKNNPQNNQQLPDGKNDIDQKGISSDTNGCSGVTKGDENNNSHYPQNPQGNDDNKHHKSSFDIDQRVISDIDQKGISDIDQKVISTNTYITPTIITPTNTTGEREGNKNKDSNNINYNSPPPLSEEVDIKRVWEKTNAVLKNTMTDITYKTWISILQLKSVEHNTLVLGVANNFSKGIIESKYKDIIIKAIKVYAPNIEKLHIEIEGQTVLNF